MKRKSNLSEELFKMRKLMNFDSEKFREEKTSLDTLMEEKMVEKYLLSEQENSDQNLVGVPWETITTEGGAYITFPKKVKLTRNQLNKLLESKPDIFKAAFRKAINDALGERGAASVSDENIDKLSEFYMDMIKTDRSFNKDLRYSIFKREKDNEPVMQFVIEEYPNNYEKRFKIQGKGTEIPPIRLYPDKDTGKNNGETLEKSQNITDISKKINNENFNNIGGEQKVVNYYSAALSDGTKDQFLYLEPVGQNEFIIVSTPLESEGKEGKIIKTPPKYKEYELDINWGDTFAAAITTNTPLEEIISTIMTQINQKIAEINQESESKGGTKVKFAGISSANIIGSATNAWDGGRTWLPPTHNQGDAFGASASSGPSIGNDTDNNRSFASWAQTVDFTVAPNGITGNNRGTQTTNADYAWGRTQLVNRAIQTINTDEGYGSNAVINSEWRITDTGGRLGPRGQFVRTTIMFVVSYKEPTPDKKTSGVNSGVIYNFKYGISTTKTSSGMDITKAFTLLSGERVGRDGKFMSQGKAIRRHKKGKRSGSSI